MCLWVFYLFYIVLVSLLETSPIVAFFPPFGRDNSIYLQFLACSTVIAPDSKAELGGQMNPTEYIYAASSIK